MSTFKNTVDTVGDEALTNSIIDRSVTEICDEYIVGIGPYAFANCSSLKKADFLSCLSIGEGAFVNCSVLEILVLRAETMCAASAGMFDGSKIAAGTGYIYVPAALVDSYKADSKWSTFADQFKKLEEWTVDNTVTGELIDDAANKYIVRFYNSDGTPLGYTIVAAGGDAVYSGADPVDPAGANPFAGFVPSPKNVTADMDCYARFADQWDLVFASIADGTYKSKYAIGDTVPLTIGTLVYDMEIVAFDADDKADGSGKAPITWITKTVLGGENNKRFNPSNKYGQEGTGTRGGWGKSELRTYLHDTILTTIPDEVRSKIVTVMKHSLGTPAESSDLVETTSTDIVWIPSAREIFGDIGHESNGAIYSDKFTDQASRIKANGNGYAQSWWSRTANVDQYGASYIISVAKDGSKEFTSPQSNRYIILGFCT